MAHFDSRLLAAILLERKHLVLAIKRAVRFISLRQGLDRLSGNKRHVTLLARRRWCLNEVLSLR